MFFGENRSNLLKELARSNGFFYDRKLAFGTLDQKVRYFRLFRFKQHRRLRNILVRDEPDISGKGTLFDFHHQKDDSNQERVTAVLIESMLLNLPEFRVRPQHIGDKFGQLFVSSTSPYDKFPEFSSRFKVITRDQEAVQYILKPEVIEFLAKGRNWIVEGHGNFLLFYQKNTFQKSPYLMDFYDACLTISNQILFSTSNDFV